MRIALVHGYFLDASGGGAYERELASELKDDGHEVTVFSQHPDPGGLPFVDEAYDLDAANMELVETMRRHGQGSGMCRHVKPNLGGRLLTIERAEYEGYASVPAARASDEWLYDHIVRAAKAVHTAFKRWPPDFVQVNHLVPLPYVTARVLGGRTPYAVTAHGGDLCSAVREDPRMVPAALEGMRYASVVVAPSEWMRDELVAFCEEHGCEVRGKTTVVSPGVDPDRFHPAPDRASATPELSGLDPADDVVTFAGGLRWTKGLQHLVAALPMIWRRRPGVTFAVAGDGPERGILEGMVKALDIGDLDLLSRLAATPDLPEGSFDYGPPLPDFAGYVSEQWYREKGLHAADRVRFLGELDLDAVAALLARTDVLVEPAVFPEASSAAVAEAVASGALAVASCHSGLREPMEALAEELGFAGFTTLVPGRGLTAGLADAVPTLLERYPVKVPGFRRRLHDLARRRWPAERLGEAYVRIARSIEVLAGV